MSTLQSEDCQTNDLIDLFPMDVESSSSRFPIADSMRIIFTGYFNGYNVEIRSLEEMTLLYHMGCFGKGSASRSEPKASGNENPRIMRKRQFSKRNYWYKKLGSPNRSFGEENTIMKDVDEIIAKIISDTKRKNTKDVIDLVSSDDEDEEEESAIIEGRVSVSSDHCNGNNKDTITVIVPNSDSEGENYFANIKPKCCLNKIKLEEKLLLSLQEAFFLVYGLGCLQIVNMDNILLTIEHCWELFKMSDQNFVTKYVVFHYYRSKGYVVKPGIKFGGDYLLYKDGPAVSHADYIVVIKPKTKSFPLIEMLGHVRVANTTVKEIIVAEVIEPREFNCESPESLKQFSVREVLLSRNLPIIINDDD